MVRPVERPEDLRRYLGALVKYFRDLRGCSPSALARAAGVSDSRVRHLLNGTQLPNQHVLRAWARKLEVPDWLFLALLPAARGKGGYTLWGVAPWEEGKADVDRRRLLALAATAGGAALARLAPLLIEEAARRVELAEAASPADLDALEARVDELGEADLASPPAALLPEVWGQLAAADALLGRAAGPERRRLLTASACLSSLMCGLLTEVGALDAAEAQAQAAYQLGLLAGDDRRAAHGLCGLCLVAREQGRYAEAARHALAGSRLAPAGTPESVWLPARYAGMLARCGRPAGEVRAALDQARAALGRVRRLSEGRTSLWVLHPGDFHTWAAAAYLEIGDLPEAAAHAREAISLWDPASGAGASPLHQGSAHADLALAHLRAGRPEPALAEGAAALACHARRPSALLLTRARRLAAELLARAPGAAAREFAALVEQAAA